jgi:serine/threonine protein kinase
MHTQGMHDFSMADVLREVEVLYTVGGHPGVISLREVYEDEEDLHLILELATGGDWFERLINYGRCSHQLLTEGAAPAYRHRPVTGRRRQAAHKQALLP